MKTTRTWVARQRGEGDERDAASLTGYNGGAREQQRLLLETMITA